jgi:hypothetical protein
MAYNKFSQKFRILKLTKHRIWAGGSDDATTLRTERVRCSGGLCFFSEGKKMTRPTDVKEEQRPACLPLPWPMVPCMVSPGRQWHWHTLVRRRVPQGSVKAIDSTAQFRCQNFWQNATVAFSLLFGKYCPIMV